MFTIDSDKQSEYLKTQSLLSRDLSCDKVLVGPRKEDEESHWTGSTLSSTEKAFNNTHITAEMIREADVKILGAWRPGHVQQSWSSFSEGVEILKDLVF